MQQLKVIKDAYFNEYHVSLEKDMGVKVEGLFGKMLQQVLLRRTDPADDVDVELAEHMVNDFTKVGRGSPSPCWGWAGQPDGLRLKLFAPCVFGCESGLD